MWCGRRFAWSWLEQLPVNGPQGHGVDDHFIAFDRVEDVVVRDSVAAG
jgi:hypothetical protein